MMQPVELQPVHFMDKGGNIKYAYLLLHSKRSFEISIARVMEGLKKDNVNIPNIPYIQLMCFVCHSELFAQTAEDLPEFSIECNCVDKYLIYYYSLDL